MPVHSAAAGLTQTVVPAAQAVPYFGGVVPAGTVPRALNVGIPLQAGGRTAAIRAARCIALSAMTYSPPSRPNSISVKNRSRKIGSTMANSTSAVPS